MEWLSLRLWTITALWNVGSHGVTYEGLSQHRPTN